MGTLAPSPAPECYLGARPTSPPTWLTASYTVGWAIRVHHTRQVVSPVMHEEGMQFMDVTVSGSWVWLVVTEFAADALVCLQSSHCPENDPLLRAPGFPSLLWPWGAARGPLTPPEDQSRLVCAPVLESEVTYLPLGLRREVW